MLKNRKRFWQKNGNNSAIGLSNTARCNGNNTRKEKLPGKKKKI
jgi:hypothetical protein